MDNWLNQNIGKVQLNPDPPRGINGQCVNSASSALMYQGGPELFPGETAWDIWLNFNHPLLQRVSGNYQPGDTLFYSPNNPAVGTGSAGHVDSYLGNDKTADADWNGTLGIQVVSGLASKAAGAFRLKGRGGSVLDIESARMLAYYIGGFNGEDGTKNALAKEMDDDLNKNEVGQDAQAKIKAWYTTYGEASRNRVYSAYRKAESSGAITKQSVLDYVNKNLG